MKRQMLWVGFLAAAFLTVAAGLALAGDRGGPRHRSHHWKDKHHSSYHAKHLWQRGYHHGKPRPHWKGRPNAHRHQLDRRGSHHRSGYRTPRHHLGHRYPHRHGWRPQPSRHHRSGKYAHRSPGRTLGHGRPGGAAYGSRPEADRGPERDRHAVERDDRRGGRGNDSNGTGSRRGNRNGDRRQRQL